MTKGGKTEERKRGDCKRGKEREKIKEKRKRKIKSKKRKRQRGEKMENERISKNDDIQKIYQNFKGIMWRVKEEKNKEK